MGGTPLPSWQTTKSLAVTEARCGVEVVRASFPCYISLRPSTPLFPLPRSLLCPVTTEKVPDACGSGGFRHYCRYGVVATLLCGQSQPAAAPTATPSRCYPRSEAMALPHHQKEGGSSHESASPSWSSPCFSMRFFFSSPMFLFIAHHSLNLKHPQALHWWQCTHRDTTPRLAWSFLRYILSDWRPVGSMKVTLPNLSYSCRKESRPSSSSVPSHHRKVNFVWARPYSCTVFSV